MHVMREPVEYCKASLICQGKAYFSNIVIKNKFISEVMLINIVNSTSLPLAVK